MPKKRRYELSDEQWARLEPLLPPEKPKTGRTNEDHRQILNGILWVLNSGAPWRDLPRRYGPVGTVSSRFYRWRQSGIWQRVLETAGRIQFPEQRGAVSFRHFHDRREGGTDQMLVIVDQRRVASRRASGEQRQRRKGK